MYERYCRGGACPARAELVSSDIFQVNAIDFREGQDPPLQSSDMKSAQSFYFMRRRHLNCPLSTVHCPLLQTLRLDGQAPGTQPIQAFPVAPQRKKQGLHMLDFLIVFLL